MEFLLDNRLIVYALLALDFWILLLLAWRRRSRGLLAGVGASLAMIVAFAVADFLIETPREQIERKLLDMGPAVKAGNLDRIFRELSSDFQFRGKDKATFRAFAESAMKLGYVEELVIWGVEWPEGGDDRSRPVHFLALPKGRVIGTVPAYNIKGKFVRENDGQWRLQSFEIYESFVNTNQPTHIPNLP